jgi:ABC-type phosphate transport system ATPase subunit
MALQEIQNDSSITALYGFSGGGYNVYHILNRLTQEQRGRLELVVVIGVEKSKLSADALNPKKFNANWELVYRNDPPPPMTHIDGPRALLTGH